MESSRADLVIVGAGAAGLLAAVAARRLGDEVIVVESASLAGGATINGDGAMWLPGNGVMAKAGTPDTPAAAADYLHALLGAPSDATQAARREAFIRTAPKLARWLASSKMPLQVAKSTADLYPMLPGAKPQGRTLQAGPLDRRVLGGFEEALLPEPRRSFGALDRLPLPRRTSEGGESLVAHLLHRAVANGVQLWLDSTLTELVTTDSAVSGVIVDRDGMSVEIAAAKVLLAGGGYERSQTLRDEHLPLPTDVAWTTTATNNDGRLLSLASGIGAATANLTDAWWTPVAVIDGQAYDVTPALRAPHSVLVDSAGDRYTDETGSGDDLGRAMYDHSRSVRAIPSYLIMDNRHRQSCALGPWKAGNTPRRALDEDHISRANTLNDLAQTTGLYRAGLLGTVVRFNNFAAKGNDSDFGRGQPDESTKGKAKADLGKIDKPPFWAIKVYPGDTGTKGGLVTDANWRVLRSDNSAVPGLYACAGTAASLFPGASPAPGAGLGEALVGAFLAVTDQR
jgi:succinate dehydrogenase/fumarate reductase flavoprotein subunit